MSMTFTPVIVFSMVLLMALSRLVWSAYVHREEKGDILLEISLQ